jgi:hypothetical protein
MGACSNAPFSFPGGASAFIFHLPFAMRGIGESNQRSKAVYLGVLRVVEAMRLRLSFAVLVRKEANVANRTGYMRQGYRKTQHRSPMMR